MNETFELSDQANLLQRALAAAGWLPPEYQFRSEPPPFGFGTDLLSWLERKWLQRQEAAGQTLENARRTARPSGEIILWLRRQRAKGACLTIGVSGDRGHRLVSWMGTRLYFWPDGIPAGHVVTLVFSHLGRKLEQRFELFRILRKQCSTLGQDGSTVLLTVESTAAFPLVRHCAKRLRLPLLHARVARSEDLADWLHGLCWNQPPLRWTPRRKGGRSWRLFVSPPVKETETHPAPSDQTPPHGRRQSSSAVTSAPVQDRLAIAFADEVRALFVRRGGRIDRLLKQRLQDFGGTTARVRLAVGPGLVPQGRAQELCLLGATAFPPEELKATSDPTEAIGVSGLLPPRQEPCRSGPQLSGTKAATDSGPKGRRHTSGSTLRATRRQHVARQGACSRPLIREVRPDDGREFLIHWTRRQNGPWPDQSRAEFLDELLFDRRPLDRSAFAALMRIVSTRRLVASEAAIRGGFRVVCFSAVPLYQLPQLRRFRAHRGRWDFELYGIAIRQHWLERRGARPAIYGDESLWNELSEADRPFFQLRFSKRDGDTVQDWAIEQEWRVLGDVELRGLRRNDALVFVPTVEQARQLAEISPWPVLFFEKSADAPDPAT